MEKKQYDFFACVLKFVQTSARYSLHLVWEIEKLDIGQQGGPYTHLVLLILFDIIWPCFREKVCYEIKNCYGELIRNEVRRH